MHESDNHPSGAPYELAKLAGEQLTMNDRAWPGMSRCTIRYGYEYFEEEYAVLAGRQADPDAGLQNLWNYIDQRDAYEITRLALTVDYGGGYIINATAGDHILDVPTRELVAKHFPAATLADDLSGFESLVSMQAAKDLLGFVPKHSWRDRGKAKV